MSNHWQPNSEKSTRKQVVRQLTEHPNQKPPISGKIKTYREKISGSLDLERETLHISDDTGRIAIFDTKSYDGGVIGSSNKQLYKMVKLESVEHQMEQNLIKRENFRQFAI